MGREVEEPPHAAGCGALVGTLRRRAGRLRSAGRKTAILLLPVLLAACAADGGLIADGTRTTTPEQPVKTSTAKTGTAKASTARAETRRSSGSSLTTASLGKPSAGKIVDLHYQPAIGSRWIGTNEMRETQSKGGRVVESMVARDRGEYRIQQKLANGYRVAYTVHDGSIEGTSPMIEVLKPVVQSIKGQSFAYETDEAGTPVRVLDIDKWKALAIKAIDAVAQTKPEFASVPQLKQLVDGVRAQFDSATPETGVALFLEPVVHYSMVQGLTNIPIGEERSYDEEVVNPLIGAKMRAKGSFKILSVDRAKGLATVEWRLVVLPEDLNKASREFVMRFLPEGKDAQALDDAMARVKLDHLDRAIYKVALADGVVRRMERTSVIKAQDMEKKTVTIMTMNPAR